VQQRHGQNPLTTCFDHPLFYIFQIPNFATQVTAGSQLGILSHFKLNLCEYITYINKMSTIEAWSKLLMTSFDHRLFLLSHDLLIKHFC
jgi:hypothetical protein